MPSVLLVSAAPALGNAHIQAVEPITSAFTEIHRWPRQDPEEVQQSTTTDANAGAGQGSKGTQGPLVGFIIGAVLLFALAAVAIYFVLRLRKKVKVAEGEHQRRLEAYHQRRVDLQGDRKLDWTAEGEEESDIPLPVLGTLPSIREADESDSRALPPPPIFTQKAPPPATASSLSVNSSVSGLTTRTPSPRTQSHFIPPLPSRSNSAATASSSVILPTRSPTIRSVATPKLANFPKLYVANPSRTSQAPSQWSNYK